MNKKHNKSNGFTLAELLIVVAIIGILVAIGLPVFASQLEKSREATDIANVRSTFALVKTSAIAGEAEDEDVNINKDGLYYAVVPLKQKKEDWQHAPADVGGVKATDTQHWREKPKPGGVCKITCDEEGNAIIYWNGGSGYTPASVDESAEPYRKALDAVLSTIYDEIVGDRLLNDNNHISYVLFNKGVITKVQCYANEADANKTGNRGQGNPGLTSADLTALNDKITKALENSGYKLSSTTERVYFDWNGNVITNASGGIGGQGSSATASLGLQSTSGKKVALTNKTGTWSVK